MNKITYFDVEWANSKNKSICQIGIICKSLENFEDLTPPINIYVNPKDQFDFHCVAVHHITQAMVWEEKTFDRVWSDIETYFTNAIIVGHNVESSDLDALVKNLTRYNLDIPELWFIDTYQLARTLIKPYEIENYKLGTLCNYFNIPLPQAHDALCDAEACYNLLNKLITTYDLNIDNLVRRYLKDYSEDSFIPYISCVEFRREINTLYGVISGMEMDSIINDKERNYLIEWKEKHQPYLGNGEAAFIIYVLAQILEDNKVTLDEIAQLKSIINQYIQYISSSKETLATQYLQGIIEGIAADETINDIEIIKLQQWLYENDFLKGHYPYNKIITLVEEILEDNLVTSDEKENLVQLFKDLINPLETAKSNIVEFENKSFVLSGDFEYGTKKEVEKYIIEKGGVIHKSVKKATNYVVVGKHGSEAYANGTYGTKVKKAMELNIPILKEEQLF